MGREMGSLHFSLRMHNKCFPKGSSFLLFNSFSSGSLDTSSSHRVLKTPVASPSLQPLQSVPQSQVPAWEVWVFHRSRAKEAPHPFDYRGKLEQPNLESLKLKGK